VIRALARSGALSTEETFFALRTSRAEPVTSCIIFALARTRDGVALRSEETTRFAEIDSAVDSAGGAEVHGLTDGVRFANASSVLIVTTCAVATTAAETAETVVRATDITAWSCPKRIADALSFLGVTLNTSAFTLDTLMTRLANIAKIREVCVADTC
jgi:hypothetical protein